MKKNLSILASLFAALAVQAAPGEFVTKAASGTTNCQVIFPVRSGVPRVVSYDLTADNATNRVYFYSGLTNLTLLTPTTAATNTTAVFRITEVSTNDSVLFQNSSGQLTNKTVTIRTHQTNQLITLTAPLGTNLAIGDTFSERIESAYQPLARFASDATTLRLSTTAGLNTNNVIVLDRGEGQPLTKATVATVVPTTNYFTTLAQAAPRDLAIGGNVYVQLYATNVPIRAAASAGATTLFVASASGMAANTNLLIEDTGRMQVVGIQSLSGTNLTLAAGLDFAVTTNSWVRILGGGTTTILPQNAGDAALLISASNGLANGTSLVLGTTPPWRTTLAGSPTPTNIYTITVSAAFGAAANPGNAIYKLTNTFTVKFPVSQEATAVVTDVSTGLAAGDRIVISPASGGVFGNRIGAGISSDLSTVLTFNSAIGITLGVADSAWLEGNSVSSLIGNATLRREAEALYAGNPSTPLRVWVSGASACSINSVTVKY